MDASEEVLDLKKRLAAAEEELSILRASKVSPPLAAPVQQLEDIRQKIANLDSSERWKTFIMKDNGVFDNITYLLEIDHWFLIEYLSEEFPDWNYKGVFGDMGTELWNTFKFRVIKKLLDPQDFDETYDFFDTAGGCDEVAQDAALEIIQEILRES
jgi:hypothetical protein